MAAEFEQDFAMVEWRDLAMAECQPNDGIWGWRDNTTGPRIYINARVQIQLYSI